MNIAISGKMASGKTTIAEIIEKESGHEKLAIAYKLKKIASLHTKENLNGDLSKLARLLTNEVKDLIKDGDCSKFGFMVTMIASIFFDHEPKEGKNRPLLQQLGHDMHIFGDDIWLDYLLTYRAPLYESIVIDDMRYPIELDRVRQNGFLTVRLEVNPEEQRRRLLELYGEVNEDWLVHPGETLLDNARFDLTINTTDMNPKETYEIIKKHIEGMKSIRR